MLPPEEDQFILVDGEPGKIELIFNPFQGLSVVEYHMGLIILVVPLVEIDILVI